MSYALVVSFLTYEYAALILQSFNFYKFDYMMEKVGKP